MPIDVIGQVIGIIGGAVQAPQRAAEARLEQERLAAQIRMAEVQAQQAQATQRTVIVGAGIAAAAVVGYMALK